MHGKWLLAFICLMTFPSINSQCACQNNGQCNGKGACSCEAGFYGAICNLYIDTYQIEYISTPQDVSKTISRLTESLTAQGFKIHNTIERMSPGNILIVSFRQKVTSQELIRITELSQIAALGPGVEAVKDYDECSRGQQCYGGLKCINTQGSFRCGCTGDDKLEDGKCTAGSSDNTKLTIYIWSGAVAGLLLLLIVALIICQRRKNQKEKKVLREAERRAAQRKAAFTPTNLSTIDRRATPPGSINAAYEIDGYKRPYTVYSDMGSVYSYNSRHALSEPGYLNHRLSEPVLDSYPDSGSLPRSRRFMSASDDVYGSYLVDANSDSPLASSAPNYIPTEFQQPMNYPADVDDDIVDEVSDDSQEENKMSA